MIFGGVWISGIVLVDLSEDGTLNLSPMLHAQFFSLVISRKQFGMHLYSIHLQSSLGRIELDIEISLLIQYILVELAQPCIVHSFKSLKSVIIICIVL